MPASLLHLALPVWELIVETLHFRMTHPVNGIPNAFGLNLADGREEVPHHLRSLIVPGRYEAKQGMSHMIRVYLLSSKEVV
jgi:hypothetical protein